MFRSVVASTLALALLTSCFHDSSAGASAAKQTAGEKRGGLPWWRQLNDPALNQDVSAAFLSNPGLRIVALRIDQADAAAAKARAASLPRINLGFGYREGRQRNVDFGPYDLAPWDGGARLSWEVDLSGKLRAAQTSATEARTAAIWDYYSARLLLASRLAAVRLNLYRFNSELNDLNRSLAASKSSTDFLAERSQAGLIPDSHLDRQLAENENLLRQKLDLERLRDLTIVQLRTLRGGSHPTGTTRSDFPSPVGLSESPLNELLSSHPGILAAEARVRSAFQLEQSARLNLLPSFRIKALANGAQKNLSDRFATWALQVGPSLDIPLYDPARLATVEARKSQKKIAAASYRETVLETLKEIETASINFANRRSQLASAERETEALERTRNKAREQFDAGLTSQIDYLDIERRWLDTRRSQSSLRQAMLNAQVNLIKATGGGRL